MKQLFLCLFCAAASLQAQSLRIIASDTAKHGDVGNSMEAHASVKNISGSLKSVKVRRVQNDLAFGHSSYFCWGGSCYGPTVNESPGSTSIAPGTTNDSTFKGYLDPGGSEGTSTVRYCFFVDSYPADSACFTVTYYASPTFAVHEAAQADVASLSVFPNPSNDVVHINYRTNAAQVLVHDMIGRTLSSTHVRGEGVITLPLASYTPGMYLVSLHENGKATQTRQLIINH